MKDSEKLDLILQELANMKSDIQDIKKRTTSIELTLENEIRPNIMRVAEGHLDLSRKLNETIKITNVLTQNLKSKIYECHFMTVRLINSK